MPVTVVIKMLIFQSFSLQEPSNVEVHNHIHVLSQNRSKNINLLGPKVELKNVVQLAFLTDCFIQHLDH